MATLLPPPKRKKLYHGISEPQELPQQAPNIVVQFVSDDDGEVLAPAVTIPANLPRDALEVLVNKLRPSDDEPVPFSFHVALPEQIAAPGLPTRIVISSSIDADILSHPSDAFTPEDILIVRCTPQSVFRVRPATRCSSSLSGTRIDLSIFSYSPQARQDMLPRYFARLSRPREIYSLRAQATLQQDCGISIRRHLLIPFRAIMAGFCVSSGRRWSGNLRLVVTMGTYVFFAPSFLPPPLNNHAQVRIWDPKTGKPIGEALKGHSKWITSLAWEPTHLYILISF